MDTFATMFLTFAMWLQKFYSITLSFRALEDFVTWVDTSKVRQHVMEYQDLRDDYEVHC